MVGTEFVLRHALQEGVKITLIVNKIDRLILELRIPPADAFYKIKHTIEEINTFIRFAFRSFAYNTLKSFQFNQPQSRLTLESRKRKRCVREYGYELVLYITLVCSDVR